MMRYIYVVLFIVIILFVAFKPILTVSADNYDYGILERKEFNIGEITLTNNGFLPLKFSVDGCCGLKVKCDKNILKHNEKVKVVFTYNSLEVSPGKFNKTIFILNNDLFHKQKIINVTGKVVGEPVLNEN